MLITVVSLVIALGIMVLVQSWATCYRPGAPASS
jgi:hypothetical protein